MVTVDILTDPGAFLAVAKDYLAADPVITSVLATNAEKATRVVRPDGPYRWFAIAHEGDRVVGAAMRTAGFEPYPLYVCQIGRAHV